MSIIGNLILLALIAIPVLGLIALWEHCFSKGEWLEDSSDDEV